MTTRRLLTVAATAGLLVVAAGCTSSSGVGSGSSRSTSGSATSASAAPGTTARTHSSAPAPKVNPLTGEKYVSGPVIAVKIDDTDHGRPQRNIDQADIVYIEQAEGGLSRLVAVFDTHKPVVGYVRSVRTSDPELLEQYGSIVLAASGGGGDSLPTLDHSKIHGWIMDRGAADYARAPHDNDGGYVNVTLDLAGVSRTAKTGQAEDMGFDWADSPSGLSARKKVTVINTVVGSTPVQFRYDPGSGRYVRYIDGVRQTEADGKAVSTPNVIVQFCQVSVHPGDVDVNGNPAQYTHSVGSGRVVVFRNGRAVSGTWSRPSAGRGTVLKDSAGHSLPLRTGGAWVVLAATGASLQMG